MQYKEYQPSALLSQHVECYWEMQFMAEELNSPNEFLSPDCTFDILFTKTPFHIKSNQDKIWKPVFPGATFLGQKTSGVTFSVSQEVRILGIRFKPFAFANLIEQPLYLFNDQVLALDQLFNFKPNQKQQLLRIIEEKDSENQVQLVEALVFDLIKKSFKIDQSLRAQFNYILDRKGEVKVNHLLSEFGISKVTLRKHFIHKMGLAPKKVSRIWRINHFLNLQKEHADFNLTRLCLEAGFYDQAHFIKEFKYFFGISPKGFFSHDSKLMKVSQEAISKRFSNQYDPR